MSAMEAMRLYVRTVEEEQVRAARLTTAGNRVVTAQPGWLENTHGRALGQEAHTNTPLTSPHTAA